ncbi:hypothetical protein ACOMCU_16345 [Lysinibacillus sp. UGB7]|uniref:hypothetical protein n=1 Tax=Lysinibacillus sp. UGB7 TaxID=3411039 RepID=UPI003B79C2B6
MNRTEEKPTYSELKKMKGFNVAQTLALQSKIFNCSLNEAWERHIHKAIHRANSKEEIIYIAKYILQYEKRAAIKVVKKPKLITEGYQYQFNSIYMDQESKVLVRYTLVYQGRYKLAVFRDNQLLYTHKELLTYPFNRTSLILRQKLNINRISFHWETFKEEINDQ